jgi:hypothetical protein
MNISSNVRNNNKKKKRSHQQAGLNEKSNSKDVSEATAPVKRRIKIDLSQNQTRGKFKNLDSFNYDNRILLAW